MAWTILRRLALRARVMPIALLVTACGLLDVTDPTVIEESDLEGAAGGALLYREALARFYINYTGTALISAFLADEYFTNPTEAQLQSGASVDSWNKYAYDRRESELLELENGLSTNYTDLNKARIDATFALGRLQPYDHDTVTHARIGMMFLVRGYGILALAENFCPGLSLDEIVDGRVVHREPLSTDQLFERALAELDSAAVYLATTDSIAAAARVVRARALLGLGRFEEAAEGVAPVSASYIWNTEVTGVWPQNNEFGVTFFALSEDYSVADLKGGNGLDYVSANDPRVELIHVGTARDGVTGLYSSAKYPDPAAPMVLASGIEARLIEAEAALHAGDPGWLEILNDLRAGQISPALDPLSDPGTNASRVDLVFRERAFWMFATGRRLGDLRRLIQHYGRDAEDVFPSGEHIYGGQYGTATSLPFPPDEALFNPAVTGCTSQ